MFLTDLNIIAEELMPILGWLGLGTAGVGLITAVIVGLTKLRTFINNIKTIIASIKTDSADFSGMFQKALPKDIKISIVGLTKTELEKISPELVGMVRKELAPRLDEFNTNMQDINKLLLSFRTVPDDVRKQVRKHLKEPYEVETFVELEMSPEMIESIKEPEKTEVTPTIKKMYIE